MLGDSASKVTMSSTKSATGHLLGAAGAIEAAFTALSIRDQVAPPTLNLEDPSVSTPIDLVPLKKKPMKIDVALSNSFGFGGTNAALVLKRLS
jgi:3-oxoacyl-[acyl-carrier-protein] synthase II